MAHDLTISLHILGSRRKEVQLLTQTMPNLSNHLNESVSDCPEGIGKQFTELSQTTLKNSRLQHV